MRRSRKLQKKTLKPFIGGSRSFTVIIVKTVQKLVISACYDVKFAGPLAPATASATSTLRASADGAPVTSGSRLSDMAPCLVVEETDPLQISNLTADSRGNLPLARKTPAKYFYHF